MAKFPFYKQHDQMDCGPTCLKMIAKYYGKTFKLADLRSQSDMSREGVSLLGISHAAESIGLRTLAVKISLNDLMTRASLPCIIHWDQNHFVVLHKVTKSRFYVADPSGGLLDYDARDFKNFWVSGRNDNEQTGVVLLIEPTETFYQTENAPTEKGRGINQLWNYAKRYKRFLLQLIMSLLLISCIQLVLPFLTQSIVDIGINTRDIQFIYLVLAGQVFLFLGRTSIEFLRRWLLLHLSTRISISLVADFLMKIMKLPLSFYDNKMIGDFLQRVDDHSRVERFLTASSLTVIFSMVNLLVFGVVLLFYSGAVFVAFLLFSIAYILYVLIFSKKRAQLDHKRFELASRNQSEMIEIIQGMTEIKLSNSEVRRRWSWERLQAKLFDLNMDSTKLLQYQDAGSLFINEAKNITITFMTAIAVISGDMTLGMMLAVQYIIGQLNTPINDFITFSRSLQDARLSLDRINEIHLLENEDERLKGRPAQTPVGGTIILSDIFFRYTSTSAEVLSGVDLIIPEGKVTAIVGSSGSGKTTLLKLLLKFYQPNSGTISFGGANLQDIPSPELRKRAGVVMQDGFIFSDTIARNIAVLEDHIDHTRLLKAVTIANIKEFIERLPLGYNTRIGKNGIGISEGQKQRLLIARAVYKEPEFILFDEATSSLDAQNEKIIMNNLDRFFEGRTVVVIAHRLSTVKNADQIVVMESGRIVEVGTHGTLSNHRGRYFDLVKNQLELGS